MTKTYEEINERIRSGKAVVMTAEEVVDLVREKGAERAAEEVDVVTTGTFGATSSRTSSRARRSTSRHGGPEPTATSARASTPTSRSTM